MSTIASWSKWFTSGDQVKKRKKNKLEDEVSDGATAIKEKDVDEVNRRLRKHTMELIFIVGMLVSVAGCRTPQVIYIPQEHKAIPLVHNGAEGWWLPNGQFSILLEKAERYDASK